MRSIEEILAISVSRKGSEEAVFDGTSRPKTAAELADIPDDRWLSAMTKAVFQAGFSWKVIETKWPGFETAFEGFDVGRAAMMSDARFDALCKDTSIVRNAQKISTVQQNAVFIQEVAAEHGGFGKMVGNWPKTDYAALIEKLKSQGSRLGGTTGQYVLRVMGVDGYILARDVVERLIAEGIIDKAPTSKSAMKAVQEAFNRWSSESGRSLTEISRILATSCG